MYVCDIFVSVKKDAVLREWVFPVGVNAVHGGARPIVERNVKSQSTCRGRGEIRRVFLPLSAGAYTTTTSYVMVDLVKRGGPAPLALASPDFVFSILMECTQKSGHCHSVCTLCVLCAANSS
jgi:hypothetical protein